MRHRIKNHGALKDALGVALLALLFVVLYIVMGAQ